MHREQILKVVSVTILSGATASSSTDISKYTLSAIEFPAAMTGTGLTLQVSQDDSTYVAVYNVTITKQDDKVVLVGTTYNTLEGLGKYIKVISSGAEGADRSFKLYLTPR